MNLKWIIGMLLVLCLFGCHSNSSKGSEQLIEEKASLSKAEKKPLVALGQLWGFLKYHHPAVAKGDYDWDMELKNILPAIMNAKKESEWKAILGSWVENMPSVPATNNKQIPATDVCVRADYGILFDTDYFESRTIEKVKQILDNAQITKSQYIEFDRGGVPTFKNEQAYDENPYPDCSHRLLGLYRYWNIINYFYPYRELCDRKWSEVLDYMLSDFVYAKDEVDYTLACLKLASLIDDSHARNTSSILVLTTI